MGQESMVRKTITQLASGTTFGGTTRTTLVANDTFTDATWRTIEDMERVLWRVMNVAGDAAAVFSAASVDVRSYRVDGTAGPTINIPSGTINYDVGLSFDASRVLNVDLTGGAKFITLTPLLDDVNGIPFALPRISVVECKLKLTRSAVAGNTYLDVIQVAHGDASWLDQYRSAYLT